MHTSIFLTKEDIKTTDGERKSPIPPVPPLLSANKGAHFTPPHTKQAPQNIPDEDFQNLFCGTMPRYILYKESNFCELALSAEIYSKSLKEMLESFFFNHKIDCAYIEFPEHKCLRFKLDNNALQFLKNPLFTGSFEIGETDLAHRFAFSIINHAAITRFQSSRRIEMLIPPKYANFGNDMANILWQNKIPCQKIKNPRTKMQMLSFGNSAHARRFIQSLTNASVQIKKEDYLSNETIYALNQKQLVKT